MEIWTTKQADEKFSKLIRYPDPCCKRCMFRRTDDCSHFIERNHSSVRYNVLNCDGFCRECHQYFHAHPNEYRKWKREQLGWKDYVALQRMGAMTMQRSEAITRFMKTQIGQYSGQYLIQSHPANSHWGVSQI